MVHVTAGIGVSAAVQVLPFLCTRVREPDAGRAELYKGPRGAY